MGTLAHPMPQAAIKNGVNASVRSSWAEALASGVSAVKSTAALPATSDSTSILTEQKNKKVKQQKKVSFNMRHQPPTRKKTRGGGLLNAQANAIVALPREFGVDYMASLHVVGNKALFVRGLRARVLEHA